jgi:hypothetical protein
MPLRKVPKIHSEGRQMAPVGMVNPLTPRQILDIDLEFDAAAV